MALTDTILYALSRKNFEQLAEEHKRLGFGMIQGLARTLALRLRQAENELTMLQEY